MDSLATLFGRSGLLPHRVCLSAAPGLLWAMVLADAVITAAYFSIPLAIVRFMQLRGPNPRGPNQPVGNSWLPWLFSAFIFACGTTHALDVWTVWQPDYGLAALSKGVTAVISLGTAVLLWRLIPAALKSPAWASCSAPSARWKLKSTSAKQPNSTWPKPSNGWPSRWPALTPALLPPMPLAG